MLLLKLDGKIVLRCKGDSEIFKYIHNKHSYSVDHAIKYEGYTIEPDKKAIKQRLTAHVLENFWPDNYRAGTVGLQNLKDQIDSMRYNDRSIYQTALDYVEGGSYLVYHDDVREFLRDLLHQTPEYSDSFSTDKVWRLYCHLIARTMAQLYADRVEELETLAA